MHFDIPILHSGFIKLSQYCFYSLLFCRPFIVFPTIYLEPPECRALDLKKRFIRSWSLKIKMLKIYSAMRINAEILNLLVSFFLFHSERLAIPSPKACWSGRTCRNCSAQKRPHSHSWRWKDKDFNSEPSFLVIELSVEMTNFKTPTNTETFQHLMVILIFVADSPMMGVGAGWWACNCMWEYLWFQSRSWQTLVERKSAPCLNPS